MSTKVKRSLFKTFLNTGTVLSPTWVLIGDGVKSGKIAYNPKVTDETFIINDEASISLDAYAPKMPISAIAKAGDAAYTYMDAIKAARSVLDAAETQIVNVYMYAQNANNYYTAELQAVSIQIDDFGGDGGAPLGISYTLNYIGDPVPGTFSPSLLAFTADPVLAILTTLVLGSGTLAPLFSADHTWLWYVTSIAAATVTMTSTCTAPGATVVQKVGVTTVGQGAAASLSMGANTLTITVTVGTEVVVYTIIATRTV